MSVERLQQTFFDAMSRHVPRTEPCALIDFPNHPNVGDSAIWLGEEEALRRADTRVVYSADGTGYGAAAVRRALGDAGTIVLHGGGNFGDEWPVAHELRDRVIRELPDRRIVVCPQTSRFHDAANLERTRRTVAAHPDITLLWRDQRSLEHGLENFEAVNELVPDAAFGLGELEALQTPDHDVLWLARTDTERAGARPAWPSAQPDVALVDWLSERRQDEGWSRRYALLREANRRVGARLTRHRSLAGRGIPVAHRLHRATARLRLQFGLELLSRGRVVVTDRLHGHILCVLAGKPHVVVDTGYGKLRGFIEAWTAGLPGVTVASSEEDALEAARAMVRAGVSNTARAESALA